MSKAVTWILAAWLLLLTVLVMDLSGKIKDHVFVCDFARGLAK